MGILAVLLTSCGAGDRGYVTNRVTQSNGAVGKVTHITLGASSSDILFAINYPVTIAFNNQDALVGQMFAGVLVSPSTTNADIVKVKAGDYINNQIPYCAIPITGITLGAEVCTTIVGEQNFQFSVKQANGVYLIRQVDLPAFKAYAMGMSAYYPAYAMAAFKFASTAK